MRQDLVQVLAARHASAWDVLCRLVPSPENVWQQGCATCAPLWVLQVQLQLLDGNVWLQLLHMVGRLVGLFGSMTCMLVHAVMELGLGKTINNTASG